MTAVHQGSGHTSLGSITHRGLLRPCPAQPWSLLQGRFTLAVNKQHLSGDVGVTPRLANTWWPLPSPASGTSNGGHLPKSLSPQLTLPPLQAVARSAHHSREGFNLSKTRRRLGLRSAATTPGLAACYRHLFIRVAKKIPRLDTRRAGGAAATAELEAGLPSDPDLLRYQHLLTRDPHSREKTPQESLWSQQSDC